MVDFNLINLLFVVSSIILISKFLFSLLFFTYIFQLKEYRWDRTRAHFKLYTGKRQLFYHFLLPYFGKLYLPRLTFRTFLVILLSLYIEYNFFFILLKLIYKIIRLQPYEVYLSMLISFVILIYVLPLIVFISMQFSGWLYYPLKQLIYHLAKNKILKDSQLLVIGITGSYGKTTAKEILTLLLQNKFRVLKTPKNCNTKLGIAVHLLKNLKKHHQIFIVEMGAYRVGEIKDICQLVKPKIGIITGINEQHMELFGNLKNILLAKYELIESLPLNGLAVFNTNNNCLINLFEKTKIRKIGYNYNYPRDIPIIFNGLFNNALRSAIVVGKFLGLTDKDIKYSLKTLKRRDFPLRIINYKNNIKVIDDSYNSNPSGFFKALTYLGEINAQKKIVISSGIIELGRASNKIHKMIGKKVAQIGAEIYITKKDFELPLKKGFLSIGDRNKFKIIDDSQKLIYTLKSNILSGTTILIEGRIPIGVGQIV